MAKGRHAEEKIFHTEPTDHQLTESIRRDEWVWVEGRVYVESYADKKHLAMDKARRELTKLGLVLHTQNGTTDEAAPLRRKWTTQRMDTRLAADILEEYQNGISMNDYAEALFDKTPEWTPAHEKATRAKTAVIVHKLKGMGLATRSKTNGLLFPTRKQSAKAIPPILMAVVRAHLSEMGEEWPDRSIQKLIKLIQEANAAVELGKAAAVAHQ